MASENKHVVFDVVGTLVGYDNYYQATEERLGQRFRDAGLGTSQAFCYAWMEAGEREYTYLSLAGRYVKFFDVFRSIFYRTLYQCGVAEPRKFATDEDREHLLKSYWNLKTRPGVNECFAKLRAAGFKVWCLTTGDLERVGGYLKSGGVELPAENFFSCDSIGVGKPSPPTYKYIIDKFPAENREAWFAAAHMWDTTAAQPAGFKSAWCSVWEKETCSDVFGDVEVVADDLPAMADAIIAYSNKNKQ